MTSAEYLDLFDRISGVAGLHASDSCVLIALIGLLQEKGVITKEQSDGLARLGMQAQDDPIETLMQLRDQFRTG